MFYYIIILYDILRDKVVNMCDKHAHIYINIHEHQKDFLILKL